ncbi:MAG: alpha/beta fold hydrolase [Acidimicrobiales bacterium]
MPKITEARTVNHDGVELDVEVGGEGPLVVLAHGFPELGFSWRHQVPALIEAGYKVAVPDMRGYGRSDRPEAVESYDITHLTGDLLAIADDLGEEQAVFVGHDWGALVVWQLALMAPERTRGVVGMSVPFLPRGPMPTIALLRQVFAGGFFYMIYFQDPGVADAELGGDPARTMRRLLAGPKPDEMTPEERSALAVGGDAGFIDRLPEPKALPDWLSQAELDHYIERFSETGFTGGLNWYRNLDRNWEMSGALAGAHVTRPSLFITGTLDPVATFAPADAGLAFLDDHRGTVPVEGAGHWVQQERPDEVNSALLGFLDDIAERKASQ